VAKTSCDRTLVIHPFPHGFRRVFLSSGRGSAGSDSLGGVGLKLGELARFREGGAECNRYHAAGRSVLEVAGHNGLRSINECAV
jgi:hypothetical protein